MEMSRRDYLRYVKPLEDRVAVLEEKAGIKPPAPPAEEKPAEAKAEPKKEDPKPAEPAKSDPPKEEPKK